jgi:hypothetical protein
LAGAAGALLSSPLSSTLSSKSAVHNSLVFVALMAAATKALLKPIFRTVFQVSGTSGFSVRPDGWLVIAGLLCSNLAPQPPFFAKQIQPPPYSALPWMIVALPHVGQRRSAFR